MANIARAINPELSTPEDSRDTIEVASGPRPEPSSRFYLPELDILRFFAFLWMFIVHASVHFPASDTAARPRFIDAGFFTVDLFLALSAYLLTQLLMREFARTGKVNPRAFYLRRILRIWPLYFVFLAIAFALSSTFQHSSYESAFTARSSYFAAYLFFLGNFANCRMGPPVLILSPLWTVQVEEQVYLFFPWIICKATPLAVAMVGTALVVIANVTRVEYAYHFISGIAVWFDTLGHIDSIGFGIILAAVPRSWFSKLAPSHRVVLATTGVACWVIAVNYYAIAVAADTPWQLILSYPLGAIGSGAILSAVIGAGSGKLTSAPAQLLIYLGKISYGLYVWHGLGITLTELCCAPRTARLTSNVYVLQLINSAISLIVTFGIAASSYKWLEVPFLKLKERFTLVASRPI